MTCKKQNQKSKVFTCGKNRYLYNIFEINITYYIKKIAFLSIFFLINLLDGKKFGLFNNKIKIQIFSTSMTMFAK